MPNRLRNEDCQVQVFVNGTRIVGTYMRVKDWSATLGISVEGNAYTGEHGNRHHSTYEDASFSLTAHPFRPVWPTLADFERKRAIGEVTGQIDIHITGRFRSAERERVKLLDCFIENPEMSGSGHDLVEEKWSGKANLIDIKAA